MKKIFVFVFAMIAFVAKAQEDGHMKTNLFDFGLRGKVKTAISTEYIAKQDGKKIIKGDKLKRTIKKFGKQGRLEEAIYLNENDKQIERRVFREYDYQGRVITIDVYNGDDKHTIILRVEYDSMNRISATISENPEGFGSSTTYFTYGEKPVDVEENIAEGLGDGKPADLETIETRITQKIEKKDRRKNPLLIVEYNNETPIVVYEEEYEYY